MPELSLSPGAIVRANVLASATELQPDCRTGEDFCKNPTSNPESDHRPRPIKSLTSSAPPPEKNRAEVPKPLRHFARRRSRTRTLRGPPAMCWSDSSSRLLQQ